MWSLTLREEHKVQVFENEVLIKIFALKKGEVSKQFKLSHTEKLHALHRSANIIKLVKSKRLQWAVHVALMEKTVNV
jgi:hypothetical protein